MKFRDYYKVLGVQRDATPDEIKRAYRKLARRFHPDVSDSAEAEARFKEVGEAYAVLKDEQKRAAYDQLGENWQAGQDFRPPPGWTGGARVRRGTAEEFSDFFESLFGGGGFGAGPFGGMGGRARDARGEDTHARIQIDLEDSYRGARRAVSLTHTEIGADGRPHTKERTLKVRIPAGVRPGQHIRLSGQGAVGTGQGGAGDLYLEIEFRPHPLFHVDGKDVYVDLPVTPWEAALGATVQVPTPTGPVDMKIPARSKSDGRLRLKGRGLPGANPGDLYVVLKIAIPAADSESQRRAYREFAEHFDFDPRAAMGARR